MSTPENPFDQTIWDPIDPRQAIEDPMHGPRAVTELLAIPPMRKDDGTYHVFGGFYTCGTNSFDAEGRPFVRVSATISILRTIRDSRKQMDWVEAYHKGDLPSRKEMGLPEFRFADPPYFVVERGPELQ